MTATTTTTSAAPPLPTRMRASVLAGRGEIRLEERPTPHPAADEVLVRVTAVGVCGSDVHFYREGALGDWVVDGPLVLGHESGGVVVATGADVSPDRVGERVSVEPQHPETSSRETLAGAYNLDPGMRFYAVPGTDGAFQEYVTIQSHFAHPVPAEVSDNAAGLLEPLSVAIAAGRKAGLRPGDRVLITGAGPVGLAMAQIARASGCTDVLVTDIAADRRRAALRFGATAAWDPTGDAAEIAASGVDVLIDASGAAPAVRAGLAALRPAGTAVLVGMGRPEYPLPITQIQNKELVVTGVFRYANTWPAAIALVARGMVDLDAMVTGEFGLADVQAALESTADPHTIKSIVDPRR